MPNLHLGLVKQKQENIPKGYKRQTNESVARFKIHSNSILELERTLKSIWYYESQMSGFNELLTGL